MRMRFSAASSQIAVARLVQQGQRPQPFDVKLTLACVEFSHFDQVGHQVVELF